MSVDGSKSIEDSKSMGSSNLADFCRNIEDYRRYITEQCDSLEVPIPDDFAVQTSFQLAQKVVDTVTLQRKLPFAQFMQEALYAPGLGYYSAGSKKLGSDGDFITAPEISPLFGKTLALSVMEAWRNTQPYLLELGAGSGRMMCDVLRELEAQKQLPKMYFILEVSAELKQRQQQLLANELPHLVERVEWLDGLPDNFKGVVIGNEVVDAIPCELLMKTEHGLAQGLVSYNNQGFTLDFSVTDYSKGWRKRHQDVVESWPEGYLAETYDLRNDWLKALLNSLDQGVIILLDYGFEQEELLSPYRPQGTLQCYYRHKKHSAPLKLLGLQDITASVNFTQLAETAKTHDTDVIGLATQAMFLTLSGIERFVAQPQDSDTISSLSIGQQLQTLLMPSEMGQNIKVLALSKRCSGTLSGFKSL